jgi:hypothetical protein
MAPPAVPQFEDEGDGREDAEQRDGEAADDLEVGHDRVNERGDEDEGHAGKAGEHAPHKADEHDDERNPEYRVVVRFHPLGDDRQGLASLLSRKRRVQAAGGVA